jgi:hypothetical protein
MNANGHPTTTIDATPIHDADRRRLRATTPS